MSIIKGTISIKPDLEGVNVTDKSSTLAIGFLKQKFDDIDNQFAITDLAVVGATYSYLRVSRTGTNQEFSGTEETVLFNNVIADTQSEYNTLTGGFTTGNSGFYFVSASVTGTFLSPLYMSILINGIKVQSADFVNGAFSSINTVLNLAASDVMTISVDGTIGDFINADDLKTMLCIRRVI